MNLLEANTTDSDWESYEYSLYNSDSELSPQPPPLQVIYPKGFPQPTTSTKKKSVSKHTSREKSTKPNVIIIDSEENSEETTLASKQVKPKKNEKKKEKLGESSSHGNHYNLRSKRT